MSESTTVIEAPAEQPPLEVPAEQPTEAAPPAPETESTEETPVSEDVLSDFLKEKGYATEAETETETDTDAEQEAWRSKLPDDAKTKLQEIESELETYRSNEQVASGQQRKAAFDTRVGIMEGLLNQLEAGNLKWTDIVPGTRLTAKQFFPVMFNAHHSDSKLFAQDEVRGEFRSSIIEGLAKQLPSAQRDSFKSQRLDGTDAWLRDFKERAIKDYVPAKSRQADVKNALSDYQAWLQADPRRIDALRSKTQAPTVSANGAAGNGRAPDQVISDPMASREDRNAAFERKHGIKPPS